MKIARFLMAALLFWSAAPLYAGPALDKVRADHSLTCGVIKEEEDYSRATDHGNRAAFDIDICKAVAVAVLGPGASFTVKIYPDEPAGVKALVAGEVELLPSASPTLAHEVRDGLRFTRPTFYDAQGFLVATDSGIRTARELADKKVCFLTGSEADPGLRAFAAREHLSYIWYPFSEAGEMEAAFFTGNCVAITSDVSQLANIRAIGARRSNEFTILPERIRKDPLAAAYRQADVQFGAIVDWTIEALIEAEELGVTSANLASMKTSTDPYVQMLLGRPLATGKLLGLDQHWSTHVLEATGNYGEVFERDLGTGSKLRIERGENRLGTHGGLMEARPPGQ